MTAAREAWDGLTEAGFGLVETGLQAGETMVASGSVIGARMSILGDAACRPMSADYAEIGGMVMEKAVAASRVNQALVGQWSMMVQDASDQAAHLGSLLVRRRPLGARDLARLAERWLAHGTRRMSLAMATGGLALAPVHQQATANARRLA